MEISKSGQEMKMGGVGAQKLEKRSTALGGSACRGRPMDRITSHQSLAYQSVHTIVRGT